MASRAYPLARGPGPLPGAELWGAPLGAVPGGPGSGPLYREVDLSFSWSQILGRTYWVARVGWGSF